MDVLLPEAYNRNVIGDAIYCSFSLSLPFPGFMHIFCFHGKNEKRKDYDYYQMQITKYLEQLRTDFDYKELWKRLLLLRTLPLPYGRSYMQNVI